MRRRGLGDPLLVPSATAPPGIIRAVEECFPRALRQRCLVHKMRNLQSQKSAGGSLARVQGAGSGSFIKRPRPRCGAYAGCATISPSIWGSEPPSAVACLDDDFAACIAHLRFPLAHRRTIRTTNLLERLFGEERRRTKVIPHAFGERAVLKLMYAALIRASASDGMP